MIIEQDVLEALEHMRQIGADTQHWEVKEAVVDLPKSLLDTISAFSNMHGGTIILGVSEKNGFHPAKSFDANKTYTKLQTVGDRLTPVVRMEIEKMIFENQMIVVAYVPELPKNQKPCYITQKGRYEGAFIRSGDGDRRLSLYEVDRLAEGAFQPHYDIEPVAAASINDLNKNTLTAIIRRARDIFPRVFATLPDETILIQLGVLTKVDDRICPTLSGLLVAGIFPQRFFPRLEVVFTVYPGVSKTGNEKTGVRYLDSKEIVGSIPDMLVETLTMVQMRMNTGAVLEGALRKDVPDYPLIAVREAVANALQHRDYSPEGRGTHVEVNMYSDRLEITNPGGLFGSTTIESLGKEGISSSRNEYLSRLLTYTPFESGYVVENKGTGFMVIESSLAQALMPPPKIQNSLTFFKLTFEKRRRTMIEMSNRSWEVIDEAIIAELTSRGSCSIKELMAMSGLSRATMTSHIRKLVRTGRVEPTENARSPKQRYRVVRNDHD